MLVAPGENLVGIGDDRDAAIGDRQQRRIEGDDLIAIEVTAVGGVAPDLREDLALAWPTDAEHDADFANIARPSGVELHMGGKGGCAVQFVPFDAVGRDNADLAAVALRFEGVGHVLCAKSGEEALRFLLKDKFAVILLDVLMPGLDGYETAALIRKREQSRNTPIIFLTAINKEDAHMLRGYDAGAVDYVFKPFDPVMLRSKVSVFVELYEKTAEIERKAAREQGLLEEALRAQSEKLAAERALRNAEAREDAILASLPMCFHARASEPPFAAKYVSKGVGRLTGFSAERFLSDPDFGLSRIHPDDLDGAKNALNSARETGDYTSEFRWRCADGEYRTFLDQGVVSKNGAAEEILGTMLDVTEQRGLQDQLLQAQRLDAIGKLTGGLAHDFNNLLAAILTGLGLIERRAPLDAKADQILGMTRRSAEQGADLVSRMLAFSRRQNLKPVAVDLRRWVAR